MATIFDYDKRSFKAFAKFYGKAPTKARQATARLLSQFAFGTRLSAIEEINRTMTVRTPRFVTSSMRYTAARPRSIDNQVAITASIAKPRSTGFREQVTQKPDKRTRTQSLLARGNNFDKRVKPRNRMKPGASFITESDADIKGNQEKVPGLIRYVKRNHKNKPFLITRKYKRIKKGLYIFKKNKMMILQNFEAKRRTPKHNPWMENARNRFFRGTDIQSEWMKAITFITNKKKF